MQSFRSLIKSLEFKLLGPRVEIWRERRKRAAIDRLRNRTLVITPIETTIRTLHLKRLLPDPLVALDLFGKAGVMKTLEYLPFVQSAEFYEIHEPFAAAARRILPRDKVTVRAADSVRAVRNARAWSTSPDDWPRPHPGCCSLRPRHGDGGATAAGGNRPRSHFCQCSCCDAAAPARGP